MTIHGEALNYEREIEKLLQEKYRLIDLLAKLILEQ